MTSERGVNPKPYKVTVGLAWIAVAVGCSIGGTSFQSPEQRSRSQIESEREAAAALQRAAPVELRALKTAGESKSAIEIVWEVPAEPVEGFIVRYGQAHEELNGERRLSLGEIERIEDPARGRLYRYVIEGVPADQRVFLSIAAFNGGRESPPSKVFEVAPGTPE